MTKECDFDFNKETHTYILDGKKLLSATQMLQICGLIKNNFYTEVGRERGTRIHLLCQYLAENDLDISDVHSDDLGYVLGYQKALQIMGFKTLTQAETPTFHPHLRYGVMADQVWDKTNILEIKTGKMMKWTAIQTALQAMALFPTSFLSKKRHGLELRKNGTYRFEKFEDPADFNVAIGVVSVANYSVKIDSKIITMEDYDERSDTDSN